MTDSSNWTSISKSEKVNDTELGPWENAGVNDGIISDFLKKTYVKERNMVIAFLILVSVTCFVGVIELLMLSDDILLTIAVALIAVVSNCFLYSGISDKKELEKIIDNKEYEVCECTAFDIDITKNEKYCYLKDTNGKTFMVEQENGEVKPMKTIYYGYFSDKEYEAKLLRAKYLKNSTVFFAFPEYYIKNKSKKGNSIFDKKIR